MSPFYGSPVQRQDRGMCPTRVNLRSSCTISVRSARGQLPVIENSEPNFRKGSEAGIPLAFRPMTAKGGERSFA